MANKRVRTYSARNFPLPALDEATLQTFTNSARDEHADDTEPQLWTLPALVNRSIRILSERWHRSLQQCRRGTQGI